VADNFDLTATSSLGLSYLFYLVDGNGNITGAPITGIYLDSKGGANDKQSFAIRLFIPCDTPENSVDITKVTATFRSDPQASRTVTDITIVRQGKMRLVKEESVDGGTAWHTSVQAQQGDTVIFRLTFTNIGTETLSNIRVIDSIPDNTVYVTGSATSGNDGTYTVYYSTDGGASWNTIEPAAGDVTHIKWTYTDNSGNLASGESHYVTYEVDLK